MAEASVTITVPGIAALPPTTVRQIGSGQVLVDPSSVVKELIDNALDARAKSIFVDITANTIDSIQVKDDGHGIPGEDRPLVCRRYCTSKIRDLQDLRDVGGKWLGFRGEALSSMADMSGAISVTTRVEGEPVAVKVKYGRNGELDSTEHDSHPVGTTVKVTGFFQHIPVRKQAAPKNATKCLAGIRRLMQAYALARPGTRLRLRVLKAKNANSDFVYAPKADANVEDAVLKIMGRDCAHQCDWTVTESNGFEIHACLPKPTATGPKIANQGSFVSIDARPVASSRGTIKQMISAYKERLRKVNPSLAGIKDPFVCVNIICPPGSYDPNIEPAKDDVMFDDGKAVLGVFERLLQSYYPEIVVNHDVDSQSTLQNEPQPDNIPEQYQEDTSSQSQSLNEETENPASGISQGQPKWRSSMYGIDEDDLEFLQHHRTPVIEEEEEQGRLAIEVSNPWTIARMNAPVKPKQSISHVQLPSPAKSNRDITLRSSSPGRPATPNPSISADPLTPRTCPNSDAARRALDEVLERSIQRLPRASSVASASIDDSTEEQLNTTPSQVSNRIILQPEAPSSILQPESQPPDPWTLPSEQHASTAARAERRRQPTRGPKPYLAPRAQNNTTPPTLPYLPPSGPSQPQSRAPEARAHPTAVQHVNRENNSDTRAFLSRQNRAVSSRNIALDSSFTRINPPDQARLGCSAANGV
ncbi:hypothetical protein ACJQWK_05665 [Exserohilum turcicum]